MADFGTPVAGQAAFNPQQGVQTLSALMGLKQQQLSIAQQQLGLQQQQQQLSSQTSEATQAAIHTQNTQALQGIDWRQFDTPNGYDIQAATDKATQVGGVDAPDFVSRLADMTQAGTVAKKSLLQLNQDYQGPVRNAFGLFGGDPKMSVSDLATQLEQISQTAPPDQKASIDKIMKSTFGLITGPNLFTGQPKSDQQQRAEALQYSRAGLSTSEVSGPHGFATPEAGTANTGTSIIPTTTNRFTGVTSPANAPPVASQSDTITLPNQQVAVLNKQTGQYVISGGGGGGSAPPKSPGQTPPMTALNDPARPSANAPAQVQQQWSDALKGVQQHVAAARDADNGWGSNMAIAQDVRALSEATNTGPGTPELTRVIGAISSQFGGSQGVTNVQTLESFLDRQAATMTKAMGLPPTNLGNEQARTIGGNIGMQGGALRAKNDYNEALAQGLHDYRSGLDHVAGPAGTPSPTAVGQYRSQWAKYFNPTAIEYKLAQQRDDRPALDAIAKSVGGPAGARRMKLDLEMMDALSSTGKLP